VNEPLTANPVPTVEVIEMLLGQEKTIIKEASSAKATILKISPTIEPEDNWI